jgi:HEAT repeat protein
VDSASRDRLAGLLTAPGRPLDVREAAAVELAAAGDRRAFETLALLLNHRDEAMAGRAARALLRLGDPRTGRAAAALATNPLRTAYALPAVRLLVALRPPEAVPALAETLQRLAAHTRLPHERVAAACAEGLAALCGDSPPPAAERALRAAEAHPALRTAYTSPGTPAPGAHGGPRP